MFFLSDGRVCYNNKHFFTLYNVEHQMLRSSLENVFKTLLCMNTHYTSEEYLAHNDNDMSLDI